MKKIISPIVFLTVLTNFGCVRENGNGSLPRGEVSAEWTAAASAFCAETDAMVAPDVAVPLTMLVVDHGKVVFEYCREGVAPDSLFHVYSIAKTVLALGAGCAVDEGLLSTGDRVVEYFPDKLPKNVSDTLSAVTVHHLLTMSCGFEETPKLLSVFSGNVNFDWIEEFFNSDSYAYPGEKFYYNFFTPYLVSAIIEKQAGTGFEDYIRPRLLEPMGITDIRWDKSPEGICIAGWGLYISTENLAKFGQLILQRGEWNGKRLVPREWIDTMTANLVPSRPLSAFTKGQDPASLNDPKNHHSHGYGYYIWMEEGGIYRAEGLSGRFFYVNPETQTVFVLMSDTKLSDKYHELIWKHFGHLI